MPRARFSVVPPPCHCRAATVAPPCHRRATVATIEIHRCAALAVAARPHGAPRAAQVFRPVVHVIMLVWKHSKHYNTPARLVVLMREICNDLIDQVCNRRVTGV